MAVVMRPNGPGTRATYSRLRSGAWQLGPIERQQNQARQRPAAAAPGINAGRLADSPHPPRRCREPRQAGHGEFTRQFNEPPNRVPVSRACHQVIAGPVRTGR